MTALKGRNYPHVTSQVPKGLKEQKVTWSRTRQVVLGRSEAFTDVQECAVCMYVCAPSLCRAWKDRRHTTGSPETGHHATWVLGTQPGSSAGVD